jgi:superfamily II DNA/RNA helicase
VHSTVGGNSRTYSCNNFFSKKNLLLAHDLPAWQSFSLHAALLHTLDKRGFTQPTPIQQETLKIYMAGKVSNTTSADQGGNGAENEYDAGETKRRDIVGIAQTVRDLVLRI